MEKQIPQNYIAREFKKSYTSFAPVIYWNNRIKHMKNMTIRRKFIL